MDLLDKPNVRQKFPVVLEDRTVYVRSLKSRELKRLSALTTELQNDFYLGKSLVKESGEPQFVQAADEKDEQFSERVGGLLDEAEVDTYITGKLIHAIAKATKFDPETITKN